MSKKRPREATGRSRAGRPAGTASATPSGWRRRVFRNSYTYRGRRVTVKHWSVKIQHQRLRRTISLVAKNRAAAEIEAQAIHQAILTQGWDAVVLPERRASDPIRSGGPAEPLPKTDTRYWKRRLLHRRHAFPIDPALSAGLSIRIEHAGVNHYFPLGTADEETGANRAREIYLAAVKEGWEAVHQRCPRELTVGIHWTENPLAWTYATIHTLVEGPLRKTGSTRRAEPLTVAIVEPDPAVRRTLCRCIDSQPGFACEAAYSGGKEALTDMGRNKPQLGLVNGNSTDATAAEFSSKLRRLAPALPILFFTIHEDSDQLFKATPGGASGYMLKRTSPERLFEPIVGALEDGDLSADRIALHVRRYFQDLIGSLSVLESAPGVVRLTHREHDILNLLSKGYLDKEIADALGISLWTVHGHLKRIYEKLGVHTRTEAAVRYLQK